jgi:hypothetical protein
MQVEIRSVLSGKCASVRYPSIPCSSVWICSDSPDDAMLRAHEEVTDGRTLCLDGDVSMSLTPDDTLDWHWTGNDAHGAVTAEAVLRRAR